MRRAARVGTVGVAALVLTAVAASGCSKDTGSKSAFCKQVRVVPPLAAVVAGFDRADPDELTRRLDGARAAYRELAKSAPSVIDDDTAELVRSVNDVLDAVREHPKDPAAVASTLKPKMADHPDTAASSAAVSAYADKECAVRLDPLVPQSSTTTATAATSTTSAR